MGLFSEGFSTDPSFLLLPTPEVAMDRTMVEEQWLSST